MSCVDQLMQLDCQDMSVCGNDCTVEDGDPVGTNCQFHVVSLRRRGLFRYP